MPDNKKDISQRAVNFLAAVRAVQLRYELSEKTISKEIWKNDQLIYRIRKGIQEVSLEIAEALERRFKVPINFVLTGKGDIFNDLTNGKPPKPEPKMPAVVKIDQAGKENIVYVDRKAKGGYLNGHADPEYIETLPAFTAPKLADRSYRAFEIEGPSMMPTLHPTDIVIASFVEDYRNIKESYVYIIVTHHDGILAKRLLNRLNDKDRGYLMARSDNREFDQFPIYEDNIIEIWQAHAKLSWNLAPPDRSMERRIDDMEINFDAMAQRVGELEQMIINRLPAH